MTTVLIQGTFDMLHWEHLETFRKAKAFGDLLIVAVNTDQCSESYKGKPPVWPYQYRSDMVGAFSCVDRVVPCESFSPLELLRAHAVDVYVICEEWLDTKADEIAFMEATGGRVETLPYIESALMTEIKRKMRANVEQHGRLLCQQCHRKI